MARKDQKLTCTFYVGNTKVDKLTPEYLDKMAQRLGEVMSVYYSQHISEYIKLKTIEDEK